MKTVRLAFVAIVLFLPVTAAFAQIQAIVSDFRGKVEVMSTGGNWIPATQGMVVAQGNTISTGFNSTAVLKMGLSTVTVQQLTRMTLQQLVENQGKVTTTLGLPIGRIQAQVRSPEGGSSDFEVRSPVSTAAVRGTDFDFDGFRLTVTTGVVAIFNQLQQHQYVAAGEQSTLENGTTPPTSGQEEKNIQSQGNPTAVDTTPPPTPSGEPETKLEFVWQ